MVKRLGYRRLMLACAAWAAGATAVQAQLPAGIAPPSTVGRELQGIDRPVAPTDRGPVVPDQPQAPQVPADRAGRQVLIRDVVIEGATAFTSAQLAPDFAPIVNRRVPFAELVAAVNRLSRRYTDAGYVFSNVVVPDQDLDSGRLRVVVIEGAVTGIEFDSGIESEGVRERIRSLLAPLIGRAPLRKAELERALLLASDTPGVTLKAGARPDPARLGGVVLVVGGEFERLKPIYQIDRLQTSPGTTVNLRAGAIAHSVLVGGDAAEARYIFAIPWNRLHLVDLRYGLPLGTDGGRLEALAQGVWQRPITTINGVPADLIGRSLLGRLQYSHPIIRQRDTNLIVLGIADMIEVDYRLQGFHIPGDSLRVLRAGAAGSFIDGLDGQWRVTGQASLGLDIIQATSPGRVGASPSFGKFQFLAQRAQPLGTSFVAVTGMSAQVATGALPSSEVFAYGGREFGRAFDVSSSVGDHAAAVMAELRYMPGWLDLPKDWIDPHLYVFADYARLWSTRPENAPAFRHGASAGVGVRARLLQRVTGEVELAKALAGGPTRPWRVSFRVGAGF